jgi:hypothetical protein
MKSWMKDSALALSMVTCVLGCDTTTTNTTDEDTSALEAQGAVTGADLIRDCSIDAITADLDAHRPPPPGADGDRPAPPPPGAPDPRMVLATYDIDGDNELSDDEKGTLASDLAVRCENQNARLLADFDDDGDGALSDDEARSAAIALREDMDAHRRAELALFDADGDGRLSPEEMNALFAAKEARKLELYDADGDGALDDGERAALRDDVRAFIRLEADDPLALA